VKEVPLRGPARAGPIGESFAMPHDATSLDELERIVTRLAQRENRWQVYRRIADETGVALAPDEIWLLVQVCRMRAAAVPPSRLEGEGAVAPERLRGIAARLAAKGMVESGPDGALVPAARGHETYQRLVAARRARLANLLQRWAPEQHAEVEAMIDGLARSLIAEPPAATEAQAVLERQRHDALSGHAGFDAWRDRAARRQGGARHRRLARDRRRGRRAFRARGRASGVGGADGRRA
jgi:hypothetical protein